MSHFSMTRKAQESENPTPAWKSQVKRGFAETALIPNEEGPEQARNCLRMNDWTPTSLRQCGKALATVANSPNAKGQVLAASTPFLQRCEPTRHSLSD